MSEAELATYRATLGVGPDVTIAELERVYLKRNFALIRGNTDEPRPELDAQRARLRTAYEALMADLKRTAEAPTPTVRQRGESGTAVVEPPRARGLITPPRVEPRPPGPETLPLFAFDNWKVSVLAPPLLLGAAWAINQSPLKFLLTGFHVWIHELGHASGAWMTGRRATPLPFGWTPVEDEFSWFVYFGLLFLFAVLFMAGWRERKVWPMLAAVGLAVLQFFMTFHLNEHQQEFWWGGFGGVGGEFYLSTLFMAFFWVQLPEKFRWGMCRYVVFFLSASAFLNIYFFWRDVNRGLADIPWGSMIGGEDDANGDMQRLKQDYGWTFRDFRLNFLTLGNWCWGALGGMYAIFALRLNRVADWVVGRFARTDEASS